MKRLMIGIMLMGFMGGIFAMGQQESYPKEMFGKPVKPPKPSFTITDQGKIYRGKGCTEWCTLSNPNGKKIQNIHDLLNRPNAHISSNDQIGKLCNVIAVPYQANIGSVSWCKTSCLVSGQKPEVLQEAVQYIKTLDDICQKIYKKQYKAIDHKELDELLAKKEKSSMKDKFKGLFQRKQG